MRDFVGRRRPAYALARLLAVGWLCVAAAPRATAENDALVEDAIYVTVPNPLTSEAVDGIAKRVSEARNRPERPVRKVVFDFNPDDKDAAATRPGACADLARTIKDLHDVATIGFVHKRVSGHLLLAVLACKEVAMGRDGRLGPIGAEGVPPLSASERQAYRDALGDSRASQWAAVQKLFDPTVSLGKGLKNGVPWFVDLNRPNEIKAEGVANAVPVALGGPQGRAGSYDVAEAKEVGLAAVRADGRDDLRDLYRISPTAFRDPLQNRSPVSFHYVLKGDVDGGMKESLTRLVKDVRRRGGNRLFLELRCGGTDLETARALADELVKLQTGDDAIQVIAYVPDRAPDAATFLALGCSEIAMSKRKDAQDQNRPDENREAEIGDFEAYLGKVGKQGQNADLHRQSLRELAERQGYSGLLCDGMFDRDLEIVRARSKVDRSRRRVMTRADLDADPQNWQFEKGIKGKNQLLKLNATLAAELGLSRTTTENRDAKELYADYGVGPGSVREAEPGWLDRFAEFLKQPVVTFMLVLVGFVGLILEMKLPGLTVPGIVAALCFILVFWSQSRFSGEYFVLAILLFLLGLVLIALEIFVLPGFGASGVVGIMCVLGGLGLATVDRVPQTASDWGELGSKMGQYLLAMVGAITVAVYIAKYLPHIPGANRLLLMPPAESSESGTHLMLPGAEHAASLLGAMGTTNTALRPSGVVRFADQFVDVVSEGGYVPPGTRVQVVEVEGTRIVVKEV